MHLNLQCCDCETPLFGCEEGHLACTKCSHNSQRFTFTGHGLTFSNSGRLPISGNHIHILTPYVIT